MLGYLVVDVKPSTPKGKVIVYTSQPRVVSWYLSKSSHKRRGHDLLRLMVPQLVPPSFFLQLQPRVAD